jgi:hypothetical protein
MKYLCNHEVNKEIPGEIDLLCFDCKTHKPDKFAEFEAAKQELIKKGYNVSAGSWIDEENNQFYVFSSQGLGPATYGHSAASISFHNGSYQKRFEKIRGNW